jgi:16S rRNA processing protein RimM
MDVRTPEWVIVGKFGRPQGLKGLIRVISFTAPSDNILQYPDWSIQKKGTIWQPVKRLDERVTPQRILTQIDGYTTREAISELTNVEIAVPGQALPPLNAETYYWHELIGMRVIHHTGVSMGIVDSVMETGSNDVLVVIHSPDNVDGHDAQPSKRRLIPYLLDDVIQKINKQSREITVCWDLDF